MTRSFTYDRRVTTDTTPPKDVRPYHHGDLPRALLEAALQAIVEVGPARSASGTWPAAPGSPMPPRPPLRRQGRPADRGRHRRVPASGRHPRPDLPGHRELPGGRRGLRRLRRRPPGPLRGHVPPRAVPHRRPRAGPGQEQARALLTHRPARPPTAPTAATSCGPVSPPWSLVHGLATLWLNHNLPPQLGDDPEQITREVARYLF